MRVRSASPSLVPPNRDEIFRATESPRTPDPAVPTLNGKDRVSFKAPKRRHSELSVPRAEVQPQKRAQAEEVATEGTPIQPSTSLLEPIVTDILALEEDDIPSSIGDGVGETVVDADEPVLTTTEANGTGPGPAERGPLGDLSVEHIALAESNGLHAVSGDDEDGAHVTGDGDIFDGRVFGLESEW